MSRVTKTFDADLELKDAGLIAVSGACQVGGIAQVLDLGEGLVEGDIIVDVSAMEADSDDESYIICPEISSVAAFTSDVYCIGGLPLGSAGTAMGDNLLGDVDMGVGRWRIPFTNEIVDGEPKRYLRLFVVVTGTVVTGINFTAFLAKR